jgi:hypothetical protein
MQRVFGGQIPGIINIDWRRYRNRRAMQAGVIGIGIGYDRVKTIGRATLKDAYQDIVAGKRRMCSN